MLGVCWVFVGALTTGIIPTDLPQPEPPPGVRVQPGIPIEVAIVILVIATAVVITFAYLTYLPKPFSKIHDK
jgi:hypothetical protein